MTDGRAAILERVRRSLATAHLPDSSLAWSRPPAPDSSADQAALLARFAVELQAVGGEFFAPEGDEAARRLVVELIREAGGGPILSWAEGELGLAGLGEALTAAGIAVERVHLPSDLAARSTRAQDLASPPAGLTGAFAALADTGSLVLLSGPDWPMSASLLPPLHIALLPRAALWPDMVAFLAAHAPHDLIGGRNLVFITGPSRTADIEMVLTRGVHGPKRLAVVVV